MNKINFKNLPDTTTPLNADNLNLLQNNVENAIDNVENAIPTIDSSVSTSSTNGVENQAITNYVDSKFNITTGSSTTNADTISGAEINRYIKIGKLCIFNFTMTAKGGWSSTALLASGLPRPAYNTRGFGLNTSTNVPLRFVITTNGELHNSYSHTVPNNSQIIEGQMTYITQD